VEGISGHRRNTPRDDMSSDVLSRPLPWERISMLYAGTQKNLAPAGMTLVILKKVFSPPPARSPAYLRYDLHADSDSLFNTPPTFIVWMTTLILRWVKSIGGFRRSSVAGTPGPPPFIGDRRKRGLLPHPRRACEPFDHERRLDPRRPAPRPRVPRGGRERKHVRS
jgi:hypothetical protein